MTVPVQEGEDVHGSDESMMDSVRVVVMKNNWLTTTFAILIWLVITVMNVALLVLLGTGKG